MLTAVTLPAMARKLLPSSEKKSPVAGRVDPSLLAQFEALAAADRRTVSFMIEEAIREYVERHHGKLPPPRKAR